MAWLQKKKLISPGSVTTRACGIANILIGKDGSNDVTAFTVYDCQDTNADEAMPTVWKLDADMCGLEGLWGQGKDYIDCPNGAYVDWTCAGNVEVFVYFIEKEV